MPATETLLTFVAAAVVFCLVPGPNVIYIVTRTLSEGRRAGVASVLGVATAGVAHVVLAAFGLSALLASSATAYDAVRYAGAAYLVVLGLRALTDPAAPEGPQAPASRSADARAAYRQGFVVNLLSPKTALFFLALLPQFVDAGAGSAASQIIVLGSLLVAIGLVNDGLYAVAAGALAPRLRRGAGLLGRTRRISGLVYIGLGVGAAIAGGRKSA